MAVAVDFVIVHPSTLNGVFLNLYSDVAVLSVSEHQRLRISASQYTDGECSDDNIESMSGVSSLVVVLITLVNQCLLAKRLIARYLMYK